MNFDELVTDTMSRLGLSSDEARTRVGTRINDRYRRVTSAIGLITSRRTIPSLVINPITATDLPDITITGMEKVVRIVQMIGDRPRVLDVLSFDDVSNLPSSVRRNPIAYAIKHMGPGAVTITLDAYPDETFTLKVEGYDIADILSGSLEPFMPTDYHYILIQGALSDELMKMEKPQLAAAAELMYEKGLSDLRMFIARNGYQDTFQGKNTPGTFWRRSWWLNGSTV